MLALAKRHTNRLIRAVAKTGVRLGRYFTPLPVARELGECLPDLGREEVRILDVGAGTGLLSAAAIEALSKRGGVRRIHLDAYEIDERMLPVLSEVLLRLRRRARHDYGVKLTYTVLAEDFLKDARGLAEPSTAARYDLVLLAPPEGVPEEGSTAEVFCRRVLPKGTDKAILFAEAAAVRLGEDGVMAAVLPLSFADSVNAAPLRTRLFARAPLVALGLDFGARGTRRDKTMLAILRYGEEPPALTVRVARRDGVNELSIPYQVAVFSDECKVLLAKTREDVALVRAMNSFPCRLADLGLAVHTGLTIEARYKESLRPSRAGGAVPLLHPAGLVDGRLEFPPRGREKPFILPAIPSLASPTRTAVLIKRVPTRKDGRHLVVGVYFSGQLPHDRLVSTDNKLNVIEGEKEEMSADLASGLAAILSSSYYERYCTLTGAVPRVNAAALLSLPLPHRDVILGIGQRLAAFRSYSLRVTDRVATAALSPYFVSE